MTDSSEAAATATAPKAPVPAKAVVAAAEPDHKPTSSTVKSPSDFLKAVLGRSVVVKLNSGVEYRGEMALGSDSRMISTGPMLRWQNQQTKS